MFLLNSTELGYSNSLTAIISLFASSELSICQRRWEINVQTHLYLPGEYIFKKREDEIRSFLSHLLTHFFQTQSTLHRTAWGDFFSFNSPKCQTHG